MHHHPVPPRRHDRCRNIRFLSPLLEYDYRPAVDEYHETNGALSLRSKPLLLYLPGFDGSFLSIFLQFPELGTIFDVRCLTVATDDRSTFDELRDDVIRYLGKHHHQPDRRRRRPVYLAGESFGGLLACEVANALLQDPEREKDEDTGRIDLKGLTLINPATSFDRSILAVEGPKAGELSPWWYPLGLLKLLPLFTDEFSGEQLLLILQAKALPSVIDNATREAYMGRVALSLPFVIPFMAQETLQVAPERVAGNGMCSFGRRPQRLSVATRQASNAHCGGGERQCVAIFGRSGPSVETVAGLSCRTRSSRCGTCEFVWKSRRFGRSVAGKIP